MKSDFLIAVTQLASERNLPREVVISAIEAALVSVYKREGETAGQNLSVKILPTTGEVKVAALKTVVEEVTDSDLEISSKEANKYRKGAAIGEIIEIESTGQFAGRIAAQTAKQVVMQRLREAERELVYQQFSDKEGEIASAIVQRLEPRQVIVDIDKTEAVMPAPEIPPNERCRPGQRMKVLVLEVSRSVKGPQVIVSRTHKDLVKRLFELEVPEVYNGTVEIRSIAREAGYRTKVAVSARQDGIDPVGSCVGLRGIRIQNIVNELHGEKIDVVQWDRDPSAFIANSLSPAQVARVEIEEEEESAVVVVADRHLSLAIGKEGQNARLAAKLTGWRIDIKGVSDAGESRIRAAAIAALTRPAPKVEEPTPEPVAVVVEAPEPEELAAVAGGVLEEAAAVVEEAAAALAEPVIEVEPAELLDIEEVPVPEELAPVAALAPIAEPEPVFEEVAVPAFPEPAPQAIEDIWPSTEQEIYRPATELRFAEDLDIFIPGRGGNKSKGKKRKGAKRRGPGGGGGPSRGPGGGMSRGPGGGMSRGPGGGGGPSRGPGGGGGPFRGPGGGGGPSRGPGGGGGPSRGPGGGGGPSRGPGGGGGPSRGPGGRVAVQRWVAAVDRPEVRVAGVAASLHSPARQGPVGSRVGGVGFSTQAETVSKVG